MHGRLSAATPLPRDPVGAPTRRGAVVEVRGISKVYGTGTEALRDINLDFPRGSADLAARAERLRQDHLAQDHRRPHRGDLRRGLRQRPARHRARPGARLRVPGFRPDAVGERDPQRRLRARAARHAGSASATRRPATTSRGRPCRLRGALSARALRRHAPARRPRPRARRQRRRAPPRRAVLGRRRADPPQVPGRPPCGCARASARPSCS